jgi:hypothetical protein
LQGELWKLKLSNFDGDHRKEEEVETWLFGMRKYFQLHDSRSNVETKIATFHLQGKLAMWWDQHKQAKHLEEKTVSWRQFKGYFQ